MSSDSAADVFAAYAELDAAYDKVLGLSHDAVSHPELVGLLARMERNRAPRPRGVASDPEPAGR